MRRFKVIFTVVCVSLFVSGIHAQENGPDDLSAYYGFKEIEIIKLDWGIKDIQIADFNGDGRNDIAIANNRKARIELLLQKETIGPGETDVAVDPTDIDVNAIIAPTRFSRESIAVSQKLYSLICGDLNSDGLTDIAFYGEPRGLYVILQKKEAGQRESLSWQTRKKIQINDGLLTSNGLACADLNHDGADDMALAGRDAVYVVLLKKDGSLAEPEKYPTSAQTLGVEVGDLNGDSINDLILVTNDNEKPLHVRFGLKTGKFGPLLRFFIERPSALMLHATDENFGDKVLAVDSISGRLMCYQFSTEDRQGTDWPILFYPLPSGQEDTKRDLALGDFDGDGLADVAISDPGAAEIIFYKQASKIGLAEPVRFPAFADIASLSAVDIDVDGKTELGVLSVKEKVIGLSEFENDRLSFPHPVDLTGEPLALELADIDSDSKTDCVYISKENDDRTLRAIHNVSAVQNGQVDSTEGKLITLAKLTSNPDGLKVLDVDQDGLQDVLIFVSYEAPLLVRQGQKGQFEIVDSPEAQSSLIKDAGLRSIALANVDGKAGDELLVVQKNFARSLIFSEGRTWNVIDQYNADSPESQISAVGAFDIGDESSPDALAIFLLDGQKGRLQMLKAGNDKTYRIERKLDVGTWSNVAHLKMLCAPLTGGEVESLLLFDSGKFALITPPSGDAVQHLDQQFGYETRIKDGLYGNLTAGDINNDGRTDIIMVERARNHIEILALSADGKPVPAMRFKIFEQKSYRNIKPQSKVGTEPREMAVADVTGDGKNDLVTVIHDRIIIYPQD